MTTLTSSATREHRDWKRLPGPLFAEIFEGATNRPTTPLVLLHGFTQTRRSWDPFLDVFDAYSSEHRTVIRVDLPGHGGSHDIAADLVTTADLVVETCGPAVYCGYSMGGRVALHAALRHPGGVHALITIGATPGIADPDERRQRRDSDEVLADRIEEVGTESFIEEWLAQPMFAGLPRTKVDLAERHSNPATSLAMSLRLSGTGTQEPLWSRLHELEMPVLLLAGARDLKFLDIADRMANVIGTNARSLQVPEAGHTAHLEQPALVSEMIDTFLHRFT